MNYQIKITLLKNSDATSFQGEGSLSEKCDYFSSLMIVSAFYIFYIVAVIHLISQDALQITEHDNLMALSDFYTALCINMMRCSGLI